MRTPDIYSHPCEACPAGPVKRCLPDPCGAIAVHLVTSGHSPGQPAASADTSPESSGSPQDALTPACTTPSPDSVHRQAPAPSAIASHSLRLLTLLWHCCVVISCRACAHPMAHDWRLCSFVGRVHRPLWHSTAMKTVRGLMLLIGAQCGCMHTSSPRLPRAATVPM